MKNPVKVAFWAGILAVVLSFVFPIINGILNVGGGGSRESLTVSIIGGVITAVLWIVFTYGFVALGKEKKSRLLTVISWISILVVIGGIVFGTPLAIDFYDTALGFEDFANSDFENLTPEDEQMFRAAAEEVLFFLLFMYLWTSLVVGITTILFGIGLLKVSKDVRYAKPAGILKIIAGATYIILIGFLVRIAAYVFELMILFDEAGKFGKKKAKKKRSERSVLGVSFMFKIRLFACATMNTREQMYVGIAAAFLLVLLVFNFGFSQNFLEQRSITGNAIAETAMVNDNLEEIILPLKVHIVREATGAYTSYRTEENIHATIAQANRIWEPANIQFAITEIVETQLDLNDIPTALNGNAREIYYAPGFDDSQINVFFAQSLSGINGIALININAALVADFTTVNDFRTTAHELGHLLGLPHVAPADRLMAQGRNGELLSEEEIQIARTRAQDILASNFYFDRTDIVIDNVRDAGENVVAKVTVRMVDNNRNADADGGKILLQNAEIRNVESIDWEDACGNPEEFEYECILHDAQSLQWFNFVNGDADEFSFDVVFPKTGESFLVIGETGGMECGAYYQSAQTGPYMGYGDGTGGPECSAHRTFVNGLRVSELGGFPLGVNLQAQLT